MAAPRMLIVFTLATAGVVLIVVALAASSWWLLAPAVVAHALAFAVATGAILKATGEETKPDPVTEARLEDEAADEPGRRDEAARRDDDEPKMAI